MLFPRSQLLQCVCSSGKHLCFEDLRSLTFSRIEELLSSECLGDSRFLTLLKCSSLSGQIQRIQNAAERRRLCTFFPIRKYHIIVDVPFFSRQAYLPKTVDAKNTTIEDHIARFLGKKPPSIHVKANKTDKADKIRNYLSNIIIVAQLFDERYAFLVPSTISNNVLHIQTEANSAYACPCLLLKQTLTKHCLQATTCQLPLGTPGRRSRAKCRKACLRNLHMQI